MPNHQRSSTYLACLFVTLSITSAAAQANRNTITDPYCDLFSRIPLEKDESVRRQLIERVAVDLKDENRAVLRARADVARQGLYGFNLDPKTSLRLYIQSALAGSQESAYNAALMLYQLSNAQPEPKMASRIMGLLEKAQVDGSPPKKESAVRGYFLAGEVYRKGFLGEKDPEKAFYSYQHAARKNYYPAIYPYLSLMVNMMPKFHDEELSVYIVELPKLFNRWKWESADIMRLAGDAYGAGLLPDDGVMAEYHWNLAVRMAPSHGNLDSISRYRRPLDPLLQKRVERMLRRTLSSRPNLGSTVRSAKPDFVDLCQKPNV